MMELVAIKSLAYAGKRREVGESFEASNRDARILVAIRKAKVAEVVKPVVAPVAQDESEVEENTAPRKRPYRRRDMRAE